MGSLLFAPCSPIRILVDIIMAIQKENIYKPVIKKFVLIIFLFVVSIKLQSQDNHQYLTNRPYAVVLGTTQDGGYPHAGCERQCCKKCMVIRQFEKDGI